MKYFLTGATGFIGGRLARLLIQRGHAVNALVRKPEAARELETSGVGLYGGDITDKESMRTAMAGVDGIFHLAAWYKVGLRDKSPAFEVNVKGTRNVLELMRELRIPRGVYTSTLGVFGDTQGRVLDETDHQAGPWHTVYGRTKWLAHYQVAEPMMQQGLPLIIVMPGAVYGPGDPSGVRQVFLQYLRRKLPALPKKTAFCWGHVEDTAEGHLLAMEKGEPGETYIIAGPMHTLIEVFGMAEKITAIPAPKRRLEPRLLKALVRVVQLVEKFVPLPEALNSERLSVVTGVTYLGTNAKAVRELGFKPRSLEEGLRETLAYEQRFL